MNWRSLGSQPAWPYTTPVKSTVFCSNCLVAQLYAYRPWVIRSEALHHVV
jgi:hypothetical protein